MPRRALLATAAWTIASPPADAAPATAHVRIEGRSSTLFEDVVATSGAAVDGGDGSGPHDCRAGASAASLLAAASARAGLGWHGTWNPDFHDFFVDQVGPDSSDPSSLYWTLLSDWRFIGGACAAAVVDGGEILVATADQRRRCCS
jgi:hypothetical protein